MASLGPSVSVMGSAPSRSANRDPPERGNPEGAPNAPDATVADDASSMEYHDPRRPAGGMPLVHYQCRKKKKSYDKCVQQWYSTDFLSGTGASLNQSEICGEKFDVYRACILKGIKSEIWDKQNLPPPLEGSPLDEIIDENDTSKS